MLCLLSLPLVSNTRYLLTTPTPSSYLHTGIALPSLFTGTCSTDRINDACPLTKRGVAGEAVEVDPSAIVNHDGVCTGVRAILMLVAPEELSSAQIEEGY